MIKRIIIQILKLSPSSKRWFWKKWYNIFARRAPNPELKLMNYGYASQNMTLELEKEDELERYPIQLYHYVASHSNVENKTVLEVGSGRGGGASYIARYLDPLSITGIDISDDAISLCNKLYEIPNLYFAAGDSENIPFADNIYDIVINVESSHCYGSVDKFLSEVYRVLKPGGLFLFCDFRSKDGTSELYDQFSKSDLKFIDRFDITDNIIQGLDSLSDYRREHIRASVPIVIRSLFETYAGIKGTEIYNSFVNGTLVYVSTVLKK